MGIQLHLGSTGHPPAFPILFRQPNKLPCPQYKYPNTMQRTVTIPMPGPGKTADLTCTRCTLHVRYHFQGCREQRNSLLKTGDIVRVLRPEKVFDANIPNDRSIDRLEYRTAGPAALSNSASQYAILRSLEHTNPLSG